MTGKPITGEPDDDRGDNFMRCPACGIVFDMRDLSQVLDHLHDGPEMPPVELPTRTGSEK